jgi:hypothetical protein
MGEVVVLKFPEEQGAKDFIMRIETQDLLAKITKSNVPIAPVKPILGTPLKPRVAA